MVYRQFAAGMDRSAKYTLLLEKIDAPEILDSLRDAYPREVGKTATCSTTVDLVQRQIHQEPVPMQAPAVPTSDTSFTMRCASFFRHSSNRSCSD